MSATSSGLYIWLLALIHILWHSVLGTAPQQPGKAVLSRLIRLKPMGPTRVGACQCSCYLPRYGGTRPKLTLLLAADSGKQPAPAAGSEATAMQSSHRDLTQPTVPGVVSKSGLSGICTARSLAPLPEWKLQGWVHTGTGGRAVPAHSATHQPSFLRQAVQWPQTRLYQAGHREPPSLKELACRDEELPQVPCLQCRGGGQGKQRESCKERSE